MLEPFDLPFVQRGLLEVWILSIPAGLLGTLIVLRGLAFFTHAVGTAAFPGLVLAGGLGFAAPLGAFGAAAAFSAGTAALPRRRLGYDSLTALVLVGCLAAGVILASDVFHSGSGVDTLLFGSLLLIEDRDVMVAAIAAAASLVAMLLLGPRWLAAGFDPLVARNVGAGSRYLEIVLLGLVALASVAALSAVGALLVTALFVVPAATARLWTSRLLRWQLASILLAAVEGTVGLWLSVKTNAPPGATIATLSGGVFALTALARWLAPHRLGLAAAVLGAVALLGACGGSDDGGNGQLKVVATTTQIADWVREVGGNSVEVDQILQPNVDSHEYEPRPSDVTNAAGADLAFANGDNLDAWIGDVISESGSGAKVIDLGTVVPIHVVGESSGSEASKYDPHWWHDPRNAEAAVSEIVRSLSAADPQHRSTYRRSAATYLAKLRGLDRAIQGCIAGIPPSERKLVSDHDAFGYFAQRYGIEVVGAVIPSQTTQAQPSAKDTADLVDLIEKENVKAIFPESSINPKLADAIASETGASSDYTLYGDTLGPADSDGSTYLQMLEANARAIVRGFSGGAANCSFAVTG